MTERSETAPFYKEQQTAPPGTEPARRIAAGYPVGSSYFVCLFFAYMCSQTSMLPKVNRDCSGKERAFVICGVIDV
jgi:hypothetical protein